MASGIIRKQITSNGYALEVHWSSTPTISTNSSVVTAVVKLVCPYALWIGARSGNTITINGKAYTYNTSAISSDYGATHTLATITSDAISHSADGSKSVAISCSFKLNATLSETHYNTVTASDTVALDNIPRAATLLTAPNFSDSDNPTITYSNPAGTAVDSISVAIYDTNGSTSYVPYRVVSVTGTSYTFNLTDAERNALLGAVTTGDSVPVKFYLTTNIGGSLYYSSLERTFSITGAKPIVTGSIYCDDATYALTGSRTTLIKYHSNVTASMTATAQKGATINEDLCIIRNGSSTGYGRECLFNNVESNVFTFSAADDRDNVGTDTVTASMVDYIKLTCAIGDNRPDALGNMTVTCVGDYFNESFGLQSNTLTVQYRYKVAGGTFGSWADMIATPNGSRYYAYANFVIPDFKQDNYYSFETRAIDKLTTVESSEISMKSKPIFHWGEDDFVFEVPVTFNAGSSMAVDDLTVTGDLRLKPTNSSFGNTIYFGDSNYVTISEPYDDRLVIKGTIVDLQGTIKHNGVELPSLQYGYWTPKLDDSIVTSYTTQNGWYQKMGQIVTIGFFIKAVCDPGFDDVSVTISNLPYYPMASATGGGMCSGVFVGGGYNFQCFVAETSGKITTRVQACNNTSPANLSTSASGCHYRFDGGEITLSGTISYMALT